MALKDRRTPAQSPAERNFVKKQSLGHWISGKPAVRSRRPKVATASSLTAQLNKANGVQTGKRER